MSRKPFTQVECQHANQINGRRQPPTREDHKVRIVYLIYSDGGLQILVILFAARSRRHTQNPEKHNFLCPKGGEEARKILEKRGLLVFKLYRACQGSVKEEIATVVSQS
ncbi:unnamed protein product [Amoebophrya sp. A25]|nr:unnamed protein product [Amoebophrya sp. A25]|eukprot:GSA25T00011161001.1